jgi:hypothetical protein
MEKSTEEQTKSSREEKEEDRPPRNSLGIGSSFVQFHSLKYAGVQVVLHLLYLLSEYVNP